jgi:hypothetical protein
MNYKITHHCGYYTIKRLRLQSQHIEEEYTIDIQTNKNNIESNTMDMRLCDAKYDSQL